jgi:putative membrane protein
LVLLIRWLVAESRPRSSGGGETALDILKKRYARGEIDQQEFEAKKRDLA